MKGILITDEFIDYEKACILEGGDCGEYLPCDGVYPKYFPKCRNCCKGLVCGEQYFVKLGRPSDRLTIQPPIAYAPGKCQVPGKSNIVTSSPNYCVRLSITILQCDYTSR